jgi:hypothetical protein
VLNRFLRIHCIVAYAGCKSETPIEGETLDYCDKENPNSHQKRAMERRRRGAHGERQPFFSRQQTFLCQVPQCRKLFKIAINGLMLFFRGFHLPKYREDPKVVNNLQPAC